MYKFIPIGAIGYFTWNSLEDYQKVIVALVGGLACLEILCQLILNIKGFITTSLNFLKFTSKIIYKPISWLKTSKPSKIESLSANEETKYLILKDLLEKNFAKLAQEILETNAKIHDVKLKLAGFESTQSGVNSAVYDMHRRIDNIQTNVGTMTCRSAKVEKDTSSFSDLTFIVADMKNKLLLFESDVLTKLQKIETSIDKLSSNNDVLDENNFEDEEEEEEDEDLDDDDDWDDDEDDEETIAELTKEKLEIQNKLNELAKIFNTYLGNTRILISDSLEICKQYNIVPKPSCKKLDSSSKEVDKIWHQMRDKFDYIMKFQEVSQDKPVNSLQTSKSFKDKVEEAFNKFLTTYDYNDIQIKFIKLLKDYILEHKKINNKTLISSPFTVIHPWGATGVFDRAVIDNIIVLIESLGVLDNSPINSTTQDPKIIKGPDNKEYVAHAWKDYPEVEKGYPNIERGYSPW